MVGRPARRAAATALFCVAAASCGAGLWHALSDERDRAAADAASARGDWPVALAAARRAVRMDPGGVEAHHRLAHASAAAAGRPTRETLGALETAYRLAPFPAPPSMVWRVDFADRYWGAIPDPLAARTVTQVDALGRMGDQWRPRVAWCRGAGAPAIAEAACATVPGVERGLDLKSSGAPPAAP